MKKKNYQALSKKYRALGRGTLTRDEVKAYLAARMPATHAAASSVFSAICQIVPLNPKSVLDLGAGPGTVSLALKELFPFLEQVTLIEGNQEMIREKVVEGTWVHAQLEKVQFEAHDVGVFGYSFGELTPEVGLKVLKEAWQACNYLVVIEPGTPQGYQNMLRARQALIGWGGHVIAPCPHGFVCPMEGKEKWCHFSTRLQRSKEHRRLKGGDLGWEDEKFSYIAVSKEACSPALGRVVGRPKKLKGHVVLPLCQLKGLEEKVVTKKEGSLYQLARKSFWGDAFPSSQGPMPHSKKVV